MNCQTCQAQLSPYMEGDLDQATQERVTDHLSRCTACAKEFAALQEMVEGIRGIPPPPVPVGFRQAVWKKIDAPTGWERLREWIVEPWYLKLPVGALATAAVVLLAVQVAQVVPPSRMAPMEPRSRFAKEANKVERMIVAKDAKTSHLRESAGLSSRLEQEEQPDHFAFPVKDLATGHEQVTQLVAEISSQTGSPIQVVERPTPNRYVLVMTPAQRAIFKDRIWQSGGGLLTSNESTHDFPSVTTDGEKHQESVGVILDLVLSGSTSP